MSISNYLSNQRPNSRQRTLNLIPDLKFNALLGAIGLSAALLWTAPADAAGLLKPQQAGYTDLKIKEHHVDVVIEDMYATTTIEQVFHNPNTQDLEAIYSFPVPEHAAVGQFSYWIDDQPVHGEVIEKQQARQIYEQEKQQGREAALVEKDQYKTFDISVFPVKAGQNVRIKLVYLQNTQTDTGIGRYVYPLEDGGVDEQKLSFWHRNEVVEEQFSFNVTLRTSYPIDGLRLPQHPGAVIQQQGPQQWRASLANSAAIQAAMNNQSATDDQTQNGSTENGRVQNSPIESNPENGTQPPMSPGPVASLDQDVVLYWRHQENLPASVDMVSYKPADQKRGTFKLTLTPGNDLPLQNTGRDWIFVLDISGSMQGKFASLIEGVREGLGKLPAQDRFKIVLFNNRAETFTQGFVPADPESVAEVLKRLDQVQPGNGTNLYAGLQQGVSQLDDDRSSAVVLVTDGVANVGVTEKRQFLKLLQQHDLRLFTFIMGNSANRPLLDEMTRVSNGFAMPIANGDDIGGQLMLAQGKMSHLALRDVEVEISGVRSKKLVMPRLSKTLYHGQQLHILGHYYQPGEAEIRLTGTLNGEKKTYTSRFTLPAQAEQHPELERLWAYTAIETMQAELDYFGDGNSNHKDIEQAITDTAVEYGLVTDYTSMIVVRDEVFKALNISRNNQQRIAREEQARTERSNQPIQPQQHRTDQQQPMFTNANGQAQSRPALAPSRSGSGGGAISPWLVIVIAVSLLLARSRSTQRAIRNDQA